MPDQTPPPGPTVTGFGESGKPRIRGNQQQFDNFVVGQANEYRQMGLGGDLAVMMPFSSARGEVERNRDRGLRNARDTERQSEMVRGGLDRKAITTVGANIRPTPQPDIVWLNQDPAWMLDYQQAASSAFQEWATDLHCRCDAEGHYQFGGLMWQGHRTMAGPDAEISGYIGYDRARSDRLGGWKWGTFVSLISPDRLRNPEGVNNGPDQPNPHGGRSTFYNGREVDENGMMEALWFTDRHPGEIGGVKPMEWNRIPRMLPSGRAMGFHWFIKRREGLQRALTTLAAVLSTVQYLNHHSTASLQHEVSRAYMAAYLKTTMSPERAAEHLSPISGDPEGRSEWDIKADHYAKLGLQFGGKRLSILGPNDELKFEGLDANKLDFDPFRNAFLRELASALGTSFEQLSLDFSRSSYSSTRSSIIEAWRQVEFERYLFCAHVPNLIYDAVIEEAFALGILKEPRGAPGFYEARAAYTRAMWTGPGMGWVDPKKEIEATGMRIDSGISTLQRESGSQGGDWAADQRQLAVERAYRIKMKLPVVPLDMGLGTAPASAAGAAEDPADDVDATEDPVNA